MREFNVTIWHIFDVIGGPVHGNQELGKFAGLEGWVGGKRASFCSDRPGIILRKSMQAQSRETRTSCPRHYEETGAKGV
jgi:hypothetical protein